MNAERSRRVLKVLAILGGVILLSPVLLLVLYHHLLYSRKDERMEAVYSHVAGSPDLLSTEVGFQRTKRGYTRWYLTPIDDSTLNALGTNPVRVSFENIGTTTNAIYIRYWLTREGAFESLLLFPGNRTNVWTGPAASFPKEVADLQLSGVGFLSRGQPTSPNLRVALELLETDPTNRFVLREPVKFHATSSPLWP